MHVLWEHDPGIYVKWMAFARGPDRMTKNVDMLDQQRGVAILKVDGEEVSPARNTHAAVG